MQRQCLKCGLQNESATGTPIEACPKCGAIYSKVEAAHSPQRTPVPAPPKTNKSRRVMIAGAACVVLIGAGLYFGISAWNSHVRQVAHQAEVNKARAELQSAKDARAAFEKEVAVLDQLVQRWNDAVQLTIRTSRIQLAVPMKTLQDTTRDIKAATFKTCLANAQRELIDAADMIYKDMLKFMDDSKFEPSDNDKVSAKSQGMLNAKIDCDAQTAGPVQFATRKLAEIEAKPAG